MKMEGGQDSDTQPRSRSGGVLLQVRYNDCAWWSDVRVSGQGTSLPVE